MEALITSIIGDQNFEIIRDQIVSILGVEFAKQIQLSPTTCPSVTKIWSERFIPINSETEVPTVNVNLAIGEYANQTIKKADGTYTYNLDVYTSAPSEEGVPGDEKAMWSMNKIVGMVRAILSYPDYWKNLLLPGIVISVKIKRFFVGDKSTVQDALSNVVGRIQVEVSCIETGNLNEGVALQQGNTRVTLNSSSQGFYYQFSP